MSDIEPIFTKVFTKDNLVSFSVQNSNKHLVGQFEFFYCLLDRTLYKIRKIARYRAGIEPIFTKVLKKCKTVSFSVQNSNEHLVGQFWFFFVYWIKLYMKSRNSIYIGPTLSRYSQKCWKNAKLYLLVFKTVMNTL